MVQGGCWSPAIVFTPHVDERNGKREKELSCKYLQRDLEGWIFSWAHPTEKREREKERMGIGQAYRQPTFLLTYPLKEL